MKDERGIAIALLVVMAAGGFATGCNRSNANDASRSATNARGHAPGHARMLAELARIAEQSRVDGPFFGQREVELLRLAAKRPDDLTLGERMDMFMRLGTGELRLGNTDAAIEAYSSLHRLMSSMPPLRGPDPALFHLGVAYMRWGENQNCVTKHNSDSCLFPIRGNGIHTKTEGSEKAIRCFTEILDRTPDPASQWLLNIAYMTIGGYPDQVPSRYLIPPSAFVSDEDFPRFFDVAPRLGLNTFGLAGGSIVDDFDNDGFLDIVESDMDTSGQLRFFRNNGNGTFSERTAEAGLNGIFGGLNNIQADYNNDGNLDILVLRGAWMKEYGRHPKSLLRNNGDGTFTDVTFDAGLEVSYPTQTAAWADYDGDGDLDLFVGSEAGKAGYPCQLFRNDGNGAFTDVAASAGVENRRFAKGVVWGDYDADGRPDIYVSNLGRENRLYHNNGDGTFSDVAPSLGVTRPTDSFATWFWDFNNDGELDIYVAPYYQAPGPARLRVVAASYLGQPTPDDHACLYQGNGHGGFEEVAVQQNVGRISFPMGANFGDLDNDGYPDFYLGTGYPEYEGIIPNIMYHNRGGAGFSDVSTAGGFGHLQKGHGVAFADIDHDGDQDVFIKMGGAFPGDAFGSALYENPGFGNHWIKVALVGFRSNRSAIGARIRIQIVENGRPRSVYKWVNSGGSFGANPLRQEIGLGKATKIERLEVLWPTTGLTQTFTDVDVDQLVRIVEGNDRIEHVPLSVISLH